jgi:hypothetical protein
LNQIIASIHINPTQSEDIHFGRAILLDNSTDSLVKIFNGEQNFLGIGQITNNVLQPKRLFV